MWNYSYIIPSIIILLIFLGYFFLQPRLPIRMNRFFVFLLAVEMATLGADYISTRADETFMDHSIAMLYVLNMLFFVFFILRIYLFARFTIDRIDDECGVSSWMLRLAPLVCAAVELVVLSSPMTHAVFYIDAGGYHSGPMYDILHFCLLFYVGLSLVLILMKASKMSRKIVAPLVIYQCFLLAGTVVRFLLPHILIMDTFCLMAIIVIFLSFGNPERFLADDGNAFNQEAFRVLLQEWDGNKKYGILCFEIHDFNEHRGICGSKAMDQIVIQIDQYIGNMYPWAHLFSLGKGRFAIVGSERIDAGEMRDQIARRFEEPWTGDLHSHSLDVSFVKVGPEIWDYPADRSISILLIALENAEEETGFADANHGKSFEAVHMIDDQLQAREALEMALAEDSVEIFLQPLIESSTGRVIAAEALARIRDKDKQLISPNIFIPLAERDGQIGLLGEQVFRKVCRLIRDCDLRSADMEWINVNLSPHQFAEGNMARRFADIIAEYGVSADQIHLEITEQTLVDYPLLQGQIEMLQQVGFSFVLDDYGSGYSNLIRIRQYPFNSLKLDMEVVWDYCRDPFPILPAFIQSLKQMGMTITAEGIEDAAMAQTLTGIGCDYLQGFHYNKPIPAEEFVETFLKRKPAEGSEGLS